jgi:hypothetical protein
MSIFRKLYTPREYRGRRHDKNQNPKTVSKTTHTPEPWTLVIDGETNMYRITYDTDDGFEDYIKGIRLPKGSPKENVNILNRIVDCFNACAGVSEPKSLRKERDEMLTLIREMVELKDLSEKPLEDEDNGLYGLADAVDYARRKEAVWKKMRELAGMNNQKPSEP